MCEYTFCQGVQCQVGVCQGALGERSHTQWRSQGCGHAYESAVKSKELSEGVPLGGRAASEVSAPPEW